MSGKTELEIDLSASEEVWDAFVRRFESLSDGALREPVRRADANGFWENDGTPIDPDAFFALIAGLD